MLRVVAGLVVLGAVVGATAAPTPRERAAGLFFPTAVGTEWVWVEDGLTIKRVISKAEPKGDVTLVTVNVVLKDGTERHARTVEVGPGGLREVAVAPYRGNFDSPTPLVKARSRPGDQWGARVVLNGIPLSRVAMTAGEPEEVGVRAGTYLAYPVVTTFPDSSRWFTTWYAEGVGPVKVTYSKGQNCEHNCELVSFSPGRR